jgi:23S rRNA (guanosine2251-2'-O)-methyltransferase
MDKLVAKELRKTEPTNKELAKIKRNPIYLVLDEVLDTYNIGSLFRLADAVAATKVYLCGNMEYPPSSRIHTAAIGTENWVPWEKLDTALSAVQLLKKQNVQVIAVEQDPRSITYSLLPSALKFPCAIVVGHETKGVSKEVLDQADLIVELPMLGINKSFNVWGSAAIVAYKILESSM